MSQKRLIYCFLANGTVVIAEHTSDSGYFPTIAVQCSHPIADEDDLLGLALPTILIRNSDQDIIKSTCNTEGLDN
jgi:hypothetical protein